MFTMVNVWTASDELLSTLKPGALVYAGQKNNLGVWCGIRKNGVKVVAWHGNIHGRRDAKKYIDNLMKYARG